MNAMPDNLALTTHDSAPGAMLKAPIDIVIPVYNAVDDLERCVSSVLSHTTGHYRLVLIDDASTDPAIAGYFDALRSRGHAHIALRSNETNVGFTLTANRGMREARGDVVLLNSDAMVTPGWLDALVRCAASDPRIGTITPFSNNAEICSFPNFCEDNGWIGPADAEAISSALAASAVPTYPDLPTGVGFCLYIRRALIDAIGIFDPVFGLGYGEENELSMRAAQAGFRNVLCDDAFVVHRGGRSFEGRKADLGTRNMALLLERHPTYLDVVRGYIAADPLRPIRLAAMSELRVRGEAEHGVLHVIHGHGGGTEHHARALIDASRTAYRHYLAIAVGDAWQVEEHLEGGGSRTFDFRREPGESWHDFLSGLCAVFRISLIHLHNISGSRDAFTESIGTLGIAYGYTVHDINFGCPTITFLGPNGLYCGAQTDPQICARCLGSQPEFAHIDIVGWRAKHREMLANASFLIAPSRWAADTFARYFPGHDIEVIPHGAPGVWALQTTSRDVQARPPGSALTAVVMPDDDVPTVAVLGAVGPDKGARRIERMVDLVRARGVRLRFVLIGYLDRQHTAWQSDDAVFTVHGEYQSNDLPALFMHYRIRLVAYPSAGPETFSFTLSESWAAGRPVIVPPFGALAERVAGTDAGWMWTEDEWRDEEKMLARIIAVLAPENGSELQAASRHAKARPQPTLVDMAEHTVGLYKRTLQSPPANAATRLPKPLSAKRVRDALGYVDWKPPSTAAMERLPEPPVEIEAAAPELRNGFLAHVSRLALRWRHTLPGRVLYRLTPTSILDALKARLF